MTEPTSRPDHSPSPDRGGAVGAMLLLADGRFPAGGHVHSGGVEAAVDDGRIRDLASLAEFTEGRLRTTGLVEACHATATMHRLSNWAGTPVDVLTEMDSEADARLLAPPLREASRRLGRQLLRSSTRCWPSAVLEAAVDAHPDGLHQPVAFGAVGVAAGLGPGEVAHLLAHHAVTTPTQAAVRLMGLDPFGAARVCADLAPACAEVAATAVEAGGAPLADLPALSSPLIEIAAVEHRSWDTRMFAT